MRAPLAALLLSAASPAFGHALLQTASPPVGSTVATAPAQITLEFSEAVEPRFSTVVVTGPGGARVDRHDLRTDPSNGERLVLGLAPLGAGTYTVAWHAVSVDTHKTEGTYHFTVGHE